MSKARSYVFTLNNYTQGEVAIVRNILTDAKYGIFGYEVGESGTPHLQGYVQFPNPRSFAAVKKLFRAGDSAASRVHIEVAKTTQSAIEYCKKEGRFEEFGDPPMTPKEKGAAEKERWKVNLLLAKKGREDELDPKVQFLHARTIDYVRQKELRSRVLVDTEFKMYWLHGPTGTGKSRMARSSFPGAYIKSCNKWWDGYKDHSVVIIDDFDKCHEVLIYYIKIWLDRYPFNAEIKGGSMMIRPRTIIITSNYTPAEIWTDAAGALEPLHRRLTFIDFSNPMHGDLSSLREQITEYDASKEATEEEEIEDALEEIDDIGSQALEDIGEPPFHFEGFDDDMEDDEDIIDLTQDST